MRNSDHAWQWDAKQVLVNLHQGGCAKLGMMSGLFWLPDMRKSPTVPPVPIDRTLTTIPVLLVLNVGMIFYLRLNILCSWFESMRSQQPLTLISLDLHDTLRRRTTLIHKRNHRIHITAPAPATTTHTTRKYYNWLPGGERLPKIDFSHRIWPLWREIVF